MNDASDATDDTDPATEPTQADVVTAFLRNRGEILLLCRSDAVGTYSGQWGGVSGFAEGDPDSQVRTEIREETGLDDDDCELVRAGRPVTVTDPDLDREWTVHPYLFDVDHREIDLSEEHDEFRWLPPTAIVDPADDRETVPALWPAYERVAPTVRSIAADDEHGAAALSIRALEVLRDRAGLLVAERDDGGDGNEAADGDEAGTARPEDEWDELAALAGRLLEARPSMAVLRNRVNRAMADASGTVDTDDAAAVAGAPAVLAAAVAGIDRATAADEEAAAAASEFTEGTVMTLSRSGTVLDALRNGSPSRVFVAESRPAREGIDVAEQLAAELDCPIAVHTDAAVAHVLATQAVDRVLVGADTVRPDGATVNKTGTRTLAVAAARADVPVTVVAAADKVSTREDVNLESGSQDTVYDGDCDLDVLNPTFDVTPAEYITAFSTERGVLDAADIEAVADEFTELADWREHGLSMAE
nr:NUDIX domain-containing protein [Natrialba taiwanensis]